MKKWKKALVSVLAGCLMLGLIPEKAQAAELPQEVYKGYQYTITVSAGDKGLIGGQEKVTIRRNPGEQVNLFDEFYAQIEVNAEDERYYVKGFRLSGRDNADMGEELENPAFYVSKDADYVVAYGIKGEQVSYTVQYQDEEGNELAPSQTFYGNVGDKPIVAYRYIDGYVPRTLALTKTLSGQPSENIFTFVYVEGDPSDIVNHVTETTTVDGTQTVTIVTGPAQAGAGSGGAGGAEETGDLPAVSPQTDTEEEPVSEGPRDIVDLDDEDTPLGDLELDEEKVQADRAELLPLAASIVIGAAAGIFLICLAVWLIRRGRTRDTDEQAGKDGED